MRLSTALRELFVGGTFTVGTFCIGLSTAESIEQIQEDVIQDRYDAAHTQSEFDVAEIAPSIIFGASCIVGSLVIISLGSDEKPAHT